jgi:hypothetical protein
MIEWNGLSKSLNRSLRATRLTGGSTDRLAASKDWPFCSSSLRPIKPMKLQKDLREFIALLNSTAVNYMVVGGHAVAFHGFPRFTGDIDFFIESSPDNAQRVAAVLAQFGFGGLGLTANDFLEAGTVVQLGRPPHRIDLLTSIDGVSFGEAWDNRTVAEMDGISLVFIGKRDLIANKRASGRPQDLADLARLEKE